MICQGKDGGGMQKERVGIFRDTSGDHMDCTRGGKNGCVLGGSQATLAIVC